MFEVNDNDEDGRIMVSLYDCMSSDCAVENSNNWSERIKYKTHKKIN